MRQHDGTEDGDDRLSGHLEAALGDIEAVRQLHRSGFLSTLESNAKRLTAPFYWYAPEGPLGSRTLGGGTICFIHTGHRLLGVTAAHIHRACVAELEQNPATACQIGGHSFHPAEHLVDIDDDLDMATYGLSEIQTNADGADIHAPPAWPPVGRHSPPSQVQDGQRHAITRSCRFRMRPMPHPRIRPPGRAPEPARQAE